MASNLDLTRLSELEEQLDSYKDDEDASEADRRNRYGFFLNILYSICDFVRKADGSPNFQDIVIKADRLLSDAVKYAYEEEMFDNMPSFAHSATSLSISEQTTDNGAMGWRMSKAIQPWHKSMKPHRFTTRLSRFRGDVAVSVTSDTPIANVIYEARCEITDSSIFSPISLTVSTDGACLALTGAGGYKNRVPILRYYFLTGSEDFSSKHNVKVGLTGIAFHSITDAQRKLIFVADYDRIKSYAWGSPSGETYTRGKPTHTMNTEQWDGPLAILGSNQIIRAGSGSVGVWDLDSLETHGADGKRRIGNVFDTENTSRDDPEDIEASSGSPANNTIKVPESEVPKIAKWHPHPDTSGVMLCGLDTFETQDYSCFALDLGHGGKVTSRYLGHGGAIQQFSTSPGDLNMFITACDDGYARLYDVRHPLPVLTLGLGHRTASCTSSVLVHPDGIPTVFTGADGTEQINMWDIRARSVVYELSTGNNAVSNMAWDSNHNALYAATTCKYMDRMGVNHGYRRAKIPSDDEDFEERYWPKQAYHNENHFGYLFDAGEHRIFRYAFKENPDTSLVPSYGQAMLG